ncbi:hypothetical protein D3C84_646730 [compost metagenome]
MFGDQPGLRVEIQRGAIQSTAGAFYDANHQIGPGARRQPGQRFGFYARDVDGVGEIPGKCFSTFRQSITQLRAEPLAFRVTTKQRFGHDHQRRAGFKDGVFVRENLLQGLGFAARQCADLQCSND